MADRGGIASPDLEHDLDAPYERADELRQAQADIAPPARVPPRGRSCTEGKHRKRKPAVVAFELSVVDGQRVLVAPFVAAACADHRAALERYVRARPERFARGGLVAIAEPIE